LNFVTSSSFVPSSTNFDFVPCFSSTLHPPFEVILPPSACSLSVPSVYSAPSTPSHQHLMVIEEIQQAYNDLCGVEQ
jgi:hypothetical protein